MAHLLHPRLPMALFFVVALIMVKSSRMEHERDEENYRFDSHQYKQTHTEARNMICEDTNIDVLGAAFFENKLMLILYDDKAKKHIVYEKNTTDYYPYMTMSMGKPYYLSSLGYTDTVNKKINSAFGVTIEAKEKGGKPEEVIVITYGTGGEKTEAISVTNRKKATFQQMWTGRMVFTAVLNYQLIGYYLVKNDSHWFMNDVQIDNQRLWAQEGQASFYVTTIGSGKDDKIILSQDDQKGNSVEWNRATGFITEDTTVHIFADSNIYIFTDLSMVNKHLTHNIFEIPLLKIPQKNFFACGTNETDLRFPGPLFDIHGSETKGRTSIIYILFGLHFVVAILMIFLIIVYSNTTTREGLRRIGRRRSSKKGPKIVRRSRHSLTSKTSNTDTPANATSVKSSKLSKSKSTSKAASLPTITTTTNDEIG